MESTNDVKLNGQEASAYLGISYSAYTRLLNKYYEKLVYELSREKIGKSKKQTYITKKGIVLLATLKNEGNNQKVALNATMPLQIQEAKVALVEKVSQPSLPAEYLNDPVIAMRMEQLGIIQAQAEFKQEIKELKEWKESIGENLDTKPLDAQQRRFMNSKVRGLGFALNVEIASVWSKLHKSMNKAKLDDYKFLDYKPTMDLLKEWYREYNVEWEADEFINQ